MRSTHFGLGFVAAGLLGTTVVQGQVQQALDTSSNRARAVTTIGVDIADEPATLAGNTDPFSAARKSQDVNYSAPNGVVPSNTANTAAPSANTASSPSNSGTAMNGSKPRGMRDSAGQQVVQNAMTSAPQNAAAQSRATSDGSDATATGPLKDLQQRLSSVRKTTPYGGTTTTEVRPSMNDSMSIPTPAATSTMAVASDMDTTSSATTDSSMGTTQAPTMASMVAALRVPANTSTETDTPATAATAGAVSTSQQTAPASQQTAPASPTKVASQLVESINVPEYRANQADNRGGGSFASKSNPTRSSFPVVAAVPALPVVSDVVSPARRSSAPAYSSETSSSPVAASTTSLHGAQTADGVLFAHQSPVLEVETAGPRSISVGKEANYSVTISNTGELAAQNVEVLIKTPEWSEVLRTKATNGETAGASSKRGEPLVWRLPRLESHAKEQLTVRLVPRESQSFDLTVQWACSPAMSKTTVEVKEPKIALTLDGPSELLFGQTKVYRLTLANPGNGDAENVVLLLAPVDGGAGAPTRHEIGLIRAGETKPVEVELSARQAGKLSIKATAVADGNLKSEVAEDILVRRAGIKTAVTGPELKFAGTPVIYNVVISNPGNCTAENICASAILPAGAKFVGSPGAQFVEDENKVTWTIPSLRAGAEQELQLTCTLSSPGTNRVQVLATAAGDLNDNISTVTNVEALADLKLEVADPPGPLAVGEEIVYEVHIRNRGTKTAENVEVAGFFSNGIEPINAQGGASEISPGQIVFRPIASIGAGSEVVLRIKAQASQPGNHVFRTEVNCPSVGAKLASEETTLFYGDGRVAEERLAARQASGIGNQTIPASATAPTVTR